MTSHRDPLRFCLFMTVFGGVLSIIGCQQKPPATDKYVPSPAAARQALDAVLQAWQAGKAPGLIENTKPQVHITDAHRKPDQRLVKYQILGEVPGNALRCFAVKATFSNPPGEEKIRFIIMGIDPLWVFRHEDFELLTHWEHKMDPVPETKSATDPNQKVSEQNTPE